MKKSINDLLYYLNVDLKSFTETTMHRLAIESFADVVGVADIRKIDAESVVAQRCDAGGNCGRKCHIRRFQFCDTKYSRQRNLGGGSRQTDKKMNQEVRIIHVKLNQNRRQGLWAMGKNQGSIF